MVAEVAELRLTCSASPSQWEGRLADGRPIYIRYRWGGLRVHFGPVGGTVNDALDSTAWFDDDAGEKMGGVISLAEVVEATGLVVLSALLADPKISNA